MAPDTKTDLTVLRNDRETTMRVTLGTMEEPKQQLARNDQKGDDMGKLGLSVAPAASMAGQGRAGLVVMGVDPSGAAADAGIQTGDVILKVGEHDVNSVRELRQALAEARSHGRAKALALVKSGGGERYVALPAAAA
jgi:serine protease Do